MARSTSLPSTNRNLDRRNMARGSSRKRFDPPNELLFLITTLEHSEVEWEVWGHSKEEAIKNLNSGHGFKQVVSTEREILTCKEEVAPQG